ncbi:DivIVA domain-containing protein [Luteipulveratus halotolerans]|uniref:DivIVA domain-containing protein n=1 Tax=Luteipulveratus halotolerans TaxID=1631356 RepID=UPI0009E50AC5
MLAEDVGTTPRYSVSSIVTIRDISVRVCTRTFSTPRGFGRSGYDPAQVDDFLDELRRMVPEG